MYGIRIQKDGHDKLYQIIPMDNFNLSELEDLKDNNDSHASEDDVQSHKNALMGEEVMEFCN